MGGRDTFKDQGAEFLRSANASTTYDYQEYMPASTQALAGADVLIRLDEGGEWVRVRFGGDSLDFEAGAGDEKTDEGTSVYQAFRMGEEIYFVTFLFDPDRSCCLLLDHGRSIVTAIRGRRGEDGAIESSITGGHVDGPGDAPAERHEAVSLAGTRFQNDYAHNVVYQHIYLNDRYDTWLSLDGPQKGQADTEEYLAFKVADGVYCTFWNEKVLTTQMTFLLNFVKGECVCEVFGTTGGERVYNTIGATTKVIYSEIEELDVPRLSGLAAD
jgi:MoaF C-terminal domain/MoaF N-terminal domain